MGIEGFRPNKSDEGDNFTHKGFYRDPDQDVEPTNTAEARRFFFKKAQEIHSKRQEARAKDRKDAEADELYDQVHDELRQASDEEYFNSPEFKAGEEPGSFDT